MSTITEIKNVQTLLNQYGENLTVDGVMGSGTIAAIKQFQLQNSLLPDGRISPELVQALNKAVSSNNSPSFISKVQDFFSENKKPIIILGSLSVFGYGIWFVKKLRAERGGATKRK